MLVVFLFEKSPHKTDILSKKNGFMREAGLRKGWDRYLASAA